MAAYVTIFLLAFWKFMFTPAAAFAMGLRFHETLILSFFGALTSVSIFYIFARFFMRRAAIKRFRKYTMAIEANQPFQPRDFSKINKLIVKVKKKIKRPIGCIVFPLFLSLPLGTIIVSKFYSFNRTTLKWLLIGTLINAFLLTLVTYFIFFSFDAKN